MEFNGLPLHVLLVHFVIVLVPLAALCTVLSALWPAARHRLGIITPILALVPMILVPIVTDAGQWLQQRVAPTPLIQAHANAGTTLYPWTIALFAVALVCWVWYRFIVKEDRPGRAVRITIGTLLAVASIGIAIGGTTDLVLIGEAGSRAIWQGSFSDVPLHTP